MLNNKNNIFVKAMFFVVLAIVLTVGVTYAYFRANITGVESVSTISVGGATLAIKYEGSNSITAENVIPGWSDKKYFNVDVTNTSGKDISYDINLVVENSNFVTPDTYNEADSLAPSVLAFALSECDSADDKTCSTFLDDDVVAIQSGEQLVHTITTKTSGKKYYALEIEFSNLDAEQSQTGTDGNPLTFSGYVTLTSTKEVYLSEFEKDSWATIASNIKSGNTSRYKVGDEKEVAIDVDGDEIVESYTVRVANNSTPDECRTEGFSQTACGFVVEFVDIIEKKRMNSSDTNVGGWPATDIYKYLNGIKNEDDTWDRTNTLYSKLPDDLKNVIIDTTVVSGHGSTSEETNFTSTDKIYLLSSKEIWSNCTESDCYDTATGVTRQLEYYSNKSFLTGNGPNDNVIKYYNGTAANWWLRTASSVNNYGFFGAHRFGHGSKYYASDRYGLAPAFRIG